MERVGVDAATQELVVESVSSKRRQWVVVVGWLAESWSTDEVAEWDCRRGQIKDIPKDKDSLMDTTKSSLDWQKYHSLAQLKDTPSIEPKKLRWPSLPPTIPHPFLT